jgi:hypothetical protein
MISSARLRMMFFQMAFPHTAILANGALFSFFQIKVWEKHVTKQRVGPAVLLKKRISRFHGVYLQKHIWKYP